MDEQLLKDFIATAQKYNYNYGVVMPKFPELSGIDLQVLKDYIATAEANNYNYAVVNPKFPELFDTAPQAQTIETITETVVGEPKKKELVQQLLDKAIATASPSTLEEQPSSSDLQESELERSERLQREAEARLSITPQQQQTDDVFVPIPEGVATQDVGTALIPTIQEEADMYKGETQPTEFVATPEATAELPDDYVSPRQQEVESIKQKIETIYGVTPRDPREAGYVAPSYNMFMSSAKIESRKKQEQADQAYLNFLKISEKKYLEQQQAADRAEQQEIISAALEGRAEVLESEEFADALSKTTSGALKMEENDAADYLNDLYGEYGFTFRPVSLTSNELEVSILLSDGNVKTERIKTKRTLDEANQINADKVKDFVKRYAYKPSEARELMDSNPVQSALRVKDIRPVYRLNEDGTSSTVLMQSANIDGKNVAFPTLFPKTKNIFNMSTNPKDWIELEGMEAYQEALSRGEVFTFETEDEASQFAKGSWKNINTVDAEADRFFDSRGYDYLTIKDQFEQYEDARDRVAFINQVQLGDEKKFKISDFTDEERRQYDDYIKDLYDPRTGQLRNDINDVKASLQRTVDGLADTYLDTDIQRVVEDFDAYTQRKLERLSQESVNQNNNALVAEAELNESSIASLGVPITEVNNFEPRNEAERDVKDALQTSYMVIQDAKTMASNKYEVANTYLDSKFDENLAGEFYEGWASVGQQWTEGWNRGQAGDEIIKYSLGITGDSTEEIAKNLVEYMSKGNSGRVSRELNRWNRSKGFREAWDAFSDNPAKLAVAFAANSMSQMLPYGMKIIPSFMLAGAGTGATYGAVTGAAVGGVGAVPGAIAGGFSGLGYGARAGFAATSYGLEYTNAVMEAMQTLGYDMMDPNSVAKALQDEKVWEIGGERGRKRGIPIGVVDYLSAGLAGRVFTTGKTAARGTRLGLQMGERVVFDPLMEGAGEYLAQVTVGDDVDIKEIMAESIGGLGNNAPMAALNTALDLRAKNNVDIANELTTIEGINKELSGVFAPSPKRVSAWANNMERLGHISPDQNQRIQENIGIRAEAKSILEVGGKKASAPVLNRAMELLAAKSEIESTQNRKEVFSGTLKEINAELKELAETNTVRKRGTEVNQTFEQGFQTDLKKLGLLAKTPTSLTDIRESKKAVYVIDGKKYTRQKFLSILNDMSPKDIKESDIKISGDLQTLELLTEKFTDAAIENLDEDAKVEVAPEVEVAETAEEVVEDVTERVNVPDPIKHTAKDRAAFKNNELETERLDGIISFILDKEANNEVLDDFENTVLKENKARVDEIVSLRTLQEEVAEGREALGLEPISPTTEVAPAVTEEVAVTEEAAPVEEAAPTPVAEEAAPVAEETTVAEEAEVETYTLPETIKERKQDFEIIDNRGEKAGIEIQEDGTGKWYVQNKKTGRLIALKTKADAQAEVKNPSFDWYGEGFPIITEEGVIPMVDFKTEEQVVEVDVVEDVTKKINESPKVSVGIPNSEFIAILSDGNMDNVAKLTAFMNLAFPQTNISTTQATFDAVMEREDVRQFKKGGQIIYGVTVDGDVYINPQVHNSESSVHNTAIHEMGHVWTDYLQATKEGKKIYAKGVELVKQTEEYQRQLKKFDGDEAKAANETIAILIGNKGETIVNASIKSKFTEWLVGMWNYIKSQFKQTSELTAEEIQNLTLDEFIGSALADIFSGKEIKLTDAQMKSLKNPEVAFKADMSMEQIIEKGRTDLGLSDAALFQILLQEGYKRNEINNALEYKIDEEFMYKVTDERTMPVAFKKVVGGIEKAAKMYKDVSVALQKFARDKKGKRVKTYSEIRQKAQDLIKAHPVYKEQTEQVQMELRYGYDSYLGYRSNKTLQKERAETRQALLNRRVGAKNLRNTQIRVRNYIRENLPKGTKYSRAKLNKLLKLATEITTDNYPAKIMAIDKVIEEQRAIAKREAVREIAKIVKAKAKTRTQSGKRRAKGVDDITQIAFQNILEVLKAVNKSKPEERQKAIDAIIKKLDENSDVIATAIEKNANNEELTSIEEQFFQLQKAFDNFGNIENMTLEEVRALLDEIKSLKAEGIKNFNARTELMAADRKALEEKANKQIQETNPELFNEDGSRKNRNELNAQADETTAEFRKRGIISKVFQPILEAMNVGTLVDTLSHLGTITNFLDRKALGLTLFTDNIYRRLNIIEESALQNIRIINKRKDQIAEVSGFETGMQGVEIAINKALGYNKRTGKPNTKIYTVKTRKTGKPYSIKFNANQMMRLYALSKNEVQREKLEAQGVDQKMLDDFREELGPNLIEFADRMVEFMSTEYFNEVNAVYRQVNGVSLGYVANYFPTRTITAERQSKALIEGGEFAKIFSAETSPAFKERKDTKGEVDLLGANFTETLDNHFENMERYKAAAIGVKQMRDFLNIPEVNTLLEESGIKPLMMRLITASVNPNAAAREAGVQTNDFFKRMQHRFTSWALAFKFIQIPKQAISFINAFEKYSYLPKGTKVPRLAALPIDLVMFTLDSALVLAQMAPDLVGLNGAISKARKMSAQFDQRMIEGLEGDVYGLESGSLTFKPADKKSGFFRRMQRIFKSISSRPTIIGDVMGVMGYYVNYKRNIANGMSEAEALEAFNDYNATQQTRRNTEKIGLQLSGHWSARAFTMFGSSLFLMMNKVFQSTTNIKRAYGRQAKLLAEGKFKEAMKAGPTAEDYRAFYLNLAIVNAAFVGVSNFFMLTKGDEDDREEFFYRLGEAMVGLNLLYNVPLIGTAAQYGIAKMMDRNPILSDVTNPFLSAAFKVAKVWNDDDAKWYDKYVVPLLELTLGVQVDPFIGLYNAIQEGFFGKGVGSQEYEDAMYDVMGVTKSYRPGTGSQKYITIPVKKKKK